MKPALRRWEPVAAAGLGAAQTLALVHTQAWALPLLALAWLAWRLDATTPRRAAWLGWCFGTAWFAAAVWWLFISMHRYGGLPAPLAAAAVFVLCAALSIYLALACSAYARWRSGRWTDALLFAGLWLLAELARGLIFTGFPWGASGYTQVDSPLALLAPWLGVYGMGAVLALAAAAAARGLQSGLDRGQNGGPVQWQGAVLVLALVGAAALAPQDFTQPAGEFRVALLQTKVKQDEKFAAQHIPETLAWVARELMSAQADLVVAPETAVPLLPMQLREFAPGYWEMLVEHFAAPGRAALLGVPLGDFDRGYTNSVAGLSAGASYRYDKSHLVPFGEFIPTGFRWFTDLMQIPLGDFARGVPVPASFAAAGQRLAPNICYEDLFGEELARRFVDAASAPTVLVNISNIGWFGDTVAIGQHLNISRLRSLELQRPMIRATNTGATAIIDHRGVVTAMLPPQTRAVLQGQVQGRQGTTPFAAWAGRWGLWPALGLALLLLGLGRVGRTQAESFSNT